MSNHANLFPPALAVAPEGNGEKGQHIEGQVDPAGDESSRREFDDDGQGQHHDHWGGQADAPHDKARIAGALQHPDEGEVHGIESDEQGHDAQYHHTLGEQLRVGRIAACFQNEDAQNPLGGGEEQQAQQQRGRNFNSVPVFYIIAILAIWNLLL